MTAYALETGVDMTPETHAGIWGYFMEYSPAYAPASVKRIGPLTPRGLVATVEDYRQDDGYRVHGIIARFPAGTGYAYTL